MSLIKCPACQRKISDKVESCPNCEYSFNQTQEESDQLKIHNYRQYRNLMYRFKMLTFVSIAIAVMGTVPMLWAYAKAIDYGFNASITNHWGIYLVITGFIMYAIIRVVMLNVKRKYKASK
jgi:predicted amidophosphoribosyltransferase